MSCNCYIPNLVIMYTEDKVKSRFDFPITVIKYDWKGGRHSAYFDNKVKKHINRLLDILISDSIDYKMYLLSYNIYRRPEYTPVRIVSRDGCYIDLQEDHNYIIDVISNILQEMTNDMSIWYGDESFNMPKVYQIWYNNPWTAVKWSDGSVTKAKCTDNETFSKEIGLSMCISKKYLECRGFEHPRKGFKSLVNDGVDLKEIHDKRDEKKKRN